MTGPLDPEVAFTGAVLHLPVDTATEALAIITHDDVADPRLQAILDAARHLIARGIDPDPVATMTEISAAGTYTATTLAELGQTVIETYQSCPVPASWRFYATGVLDQALRRRCRELSTRIDQAADGPIDTLAELVAAEHDAVLELDRRRAALLPAPKLGVAA